MPKSITISKSHQEMLVKHAQSTFPDESCALLFGRADESSILVSDVFLAENSQKSQTQFAISNEDLIRGYDEARKTGLDVVGIFHSHPHSDAIPSATDKKFMQVNPVAWIIFSNKSGEMRAYILEDEVVPLAMQNA